MTAQRSQQHQRTQHQQHPKQQDPREAEQRPAPSQPQSQEIEPTEVLAAGSAIMEQTRGEVDMQVSTAKRFPRSLKRFREEVLTMATTDKETATECTYAIPRDGKFIVGPSVRFAEILASSWGNIREEKRSLEPEERVIRGQGTVWDLERNRLVRAEVTRRIYGKRGRYNDDMIAMTGNAAASIAHRNAILACIPKALWKDVHDQVMRVAAGDAKTLEENRKQWLAYWAKEGVSVERILSALRKPSVDDIGLTELGILQGVCTAYRDGGLSLDDAFPQPQQPEKPQAGRARVGSTQQQQQPPDEPPHDPATGEVAQAAQATAQAAQEQGGHETPGPLHPSTPPQGQSRLKF